MSGGAARCLQPLATGIRDETHVASLTARPVAGRRAGRCVGCRATARGPARPPRYGFSALPPSRTLPCATLVPGGTLCVSHTLPPITEPRPIVTRPRMVAPA